MTGVTFLHEDYCTHQFARYLCRLCSLPDILSPHDSNIDSHAWLFCVLYLPLLFRSGITSSVEGIWLDVLLAWSLLLDLGRQIFYWSKLTMPRPHIQPWVRGRRTGSFPKQWLVIEPKVAMDHFHCRTMKNNKSKTIAFWVNEVLTKDKRKGKDLYKF